MADLSNNSFIPKRGPVKHNRGTASRQVYLFTLISYILMFATLLAAGSVFLYGKHIDNQLESEVSKLNTEIGSFVESDMQKVLEFNLRLSQASGRLNNSVSLVSVFDALESATIDTVKINSLTLEREKDEKFILAATIETDSFDSTIFQRGVYNRNQTIESVSIAAVQASNDSSGTEGPSKRPTVSFTAKLEVPLSSVPYTDSVNSSNPITINNSAIQTNEVDAEEGNDTSTSTLESNVENI